MARFLCCTLAEIPRINQKVGLASIPIYQSDFASIVLCDILAFTQDQSPSIFSSGYASPSPTLPVTLICLSGNKIHGYICRGN
jgi:hypothetical protein